MGGGGHRTFSAATLRLFEQLLKQVNVSVGASSSPDEFEADARKVGTAMRELQEALADDDGGGE